MPQILDTLFGEISHLARYSSSELVNTYQPRDYCLQYRETNLHFISRLLQEAGIYYYFKHEDGQHTLILGDSPSAIKPGADENAVYTAGSHKDTCITRWSRGYQVYTGKVTHTDYNYHTPDTSLQTQQQDKATLRVAQNYERYHYPGLYQDHGDGQTLADQHLDALQVSYDISEGESNYASFGAGTKFTFTNPPNEADEDHYAILSVMHDAIDNSYLHGSTGNQSYHNIFHCMPASVTYRPAHTLVLWGFL